LSETKAELIERFVSEFPGLQGALAEHLAENHEELLPHVFLFDVVRYATELFVRSSNATDNDARRDAARAELQRMLEVVEDEYLHGSEDARELIVVSFLENLPTPDEGAAEIRFLLGAATRKKLEEIWPTTI
jgi:hypothetical protein